MATGQMSEVIQHLRRFMLLRDGAGLNDGQLLDEFISRQDESALTALVGRHGPMVWGVCRRVLRDYHDAEDAFQATFLVLVRRAASIASRELLANWLYGVAHQTALKARATAAKRYKRERRVAKMPEPAAAEQELWHDLAPLLDEEIRRLPDNYRAVIVLCDLEGKTRKEAAAELRCPEGTVAGRLARARRKLANRLIARGVAFSGGALSAVLSQQAFSASVPSALLSSTIQAASLLRAGHAAAAGAISAKVSALVEGVLKAMYITKIKHTLLAILMFVGVLGSGIAYHYLQAADPPVQAKDAPAKDKKVDRPAKLNASRFDAAKKAFAAIWSDYERGRHDEEAVYRWSLRVLESQRASAENPGAEIKAFEAHLERMKALAKAAPERMVAVPLERIANDGAAKGIMVTKEGKRVAILVDLGFRPPHAAETTAFYRAEAEVWLAETQTKKAAENR
jgi:RNA polymerase sigma factor (sigma-70 family)